MAFMEVSERGAGKEKDDSLAVEPQSGVETVEQEEPATVAARGDDNGTSHVCAREGFGVERGVRRWWAANCRQPQALD